MSDLTSADVLAMTRTNENGIFGGSGITLIVLILFFLTMGNGVWGGNNSAAQGALTRAELYDGLNSQNTFSEFRSTQSEITNGFANINQNLSDNFANVTLGMNNGFNTVNSNLQSVASQMAQCCCDLKTTMHNEGEATRALIQQNVIQSLRDEVSAKDRELLTTGLTAAQVVQTNNLENFMRTLINGCSCGA